MMQEVLFRVAEANARAHRRHEGDYIEDGLLYCGVCRQPRQCCVPGLPFQPFIPCECEQKKKEEEERAHREALLRITAAENTAKCFQSPLQKTYTFAADDGGNPRLTALARRYAEQFAEMRSRENRRGLLLYGPPGGGKSYMACAVCNELLPKGYRCKVTSLPEIVNDLPCVYDKNEYLRELCKNDLLVLDDFGTQRDTDYMNEQTFNVVNALLLHRVPVIVTTNMTGEELIGADGAPLGRITSRLFEMCFPFEVTHRDRRRDGLKKDYAAQRTLLSGATGGG